MDVAAVETGVWSPGRRTLTLGLVLTITLVGFEALAIATVMPIVSRDLGGIEWYGWVFSAFFLGNLLGIVAAARDADRVGPARPFIVGCVLFGGGLLLGGLAPSMPALVGARVVQGVGAGAIPAVAYVAIGRAYPLALQPRMFAWLSSAWVIPAVVGPAVSGAIADTFGWRWVFLGLLPLVVIAGAMTLPALRSLGSPGGDEPVDRRVQALVLTIGAALVLAGASSRNPIASVPLVIAGFVLGSRAFLRLMPAGTVRLARGLPAAVAIRGIITFAFFGTDAFVSLTLESVHHISATVTGLVLTASTLCWTAGAWVQERFVARLGPQAFVRTGACAIVGGIAGMIAVAHNDLPIGVAVAAWGLAGLGMGLAFAPLSLVVLGGAPKGGEGSATAALQLCEVLGIALGTGASGAIVAAGATLGWQESSALVVAFALCGAFGIAAALAATRLPRAIGSVPVS